MSLGIAFYAGVRDEIDEVYLWYERQKEGLGESFLTALQVVFDQISQNPKAFAPIHRTIRHLRLKRFPFAVYYQVKLAQIEVIAVHHSSRDPKTWKSRT